MARSQQQQRRCVLINGTCDSTVDIVRWMVGSRRDVVRKNGREKGKGRGEERGGRDVALVNSQADESVNMGAKEIGRVHSKGHW